MKTEVKKFLEENGYAKDQDINNIFYKWCGTYASIRCNIIILNDSVDAIVFVECVADYDSRDELLSEISVAINMNEEIANKVRGMLGYDKGTRKRS